MNATAHEFLNLTDEEFDILAELLESERIRLLVGIRHTDHRAYRTQLQGRLSLLERLIARCGSGVSGKAETASSGTS